MATAPHSEPARSGADRRTTRYERLLSQRRTSFRRWLLAHIYDIRSLLYEARISLMGFLVVMASGTLYWRYVYDGADYTIGAAVFETMRMLALEHGESFPGDILGKLLFFAIPIFGLGFVFQGVLDFGRLLLDKSARLEAWQLSLARTYRDHVIVCGLGSVSYRVVLQLLDSGHEVVIIEQHWNSEYVPYALALKLPVVHGDAHDRRTLEQAGIARARGLLAATSDDLRNIKLALEAQRSRPNLHIVLRIFNEDLDNHLEQTRFGPNTAFSSSALAAPTMAAASVCRGIKAALPLYDGMLAVSDLEITAGSKLEGPIWQAEQALNVQVVAHCGTDRARRQPAWNLRPDPDTMLAAGDQVVLLGALPALGNAWLHGRSFEELSTHLGGTFQHRLTPTHNRVIVCGLGTVGYRVVKELYQLKPRPEVVVICDQDTRDTFKEEIKAMNIPIIQGDSRAAKVLHEAGIERAYSVVAVTSNKLINVQTCLAARHIRSDIDLVLRVFSDVLADQLEDMFGVHTTYSTSVLAAVTLAAAVVVQNTGYAVDIGTSMLASASVTVRAGDGLAGQSVRALRSAQGITVISLRRGDALHIRPEQPDYTTRLLAATLQPGDEVVVLGEIHTVAGQRHRSSRVVQGKGYITQPLSPAQLAGLPAAAVVAASEPSYAGAEQAEPAAEPGALSGSQR